MSRADPAAATLDLTRCDACGHENPPVARFCGHCGAPIGAPVRIRPVTTADPLIGAIVADRYRILELLGRGGMGVVYKVEHVHIGKQMAMKLLHGELAREKNTQKRFQREADAASRLSHPNTVQVFDFGRAEGMTYLVMELLEGRDLGQVIREEGALAYPRAARICAQVCASVAEAHGHRIVHRDIKPENVMILPARDGRPEVAKVLDFGLAKLRDHVGGMTVTRAGAIVGTPYYMPPEQIRGEDVDPRGDVYAIGAMFYKACTGEPPFVASSPMGVLTKHLTEAVEPPSERAPSAGLPAAVDAVVACAMAKAPEDRYPSAEALRQDLLALQGESGSEPTLSALRIGGTPEIATRGDVDRYERSLRRRGVFTYLVMVAALGAAGVAAFLGVQRWNQREIIPDMEVEPNDTPEDAMVLPPGVTVRGYLGKRQSQAIGDVDLWIVENRSGERRFLTAELGGIPNIDIVLEVFRRGMPDPIVTADTRGVGGPERLPPFPFPPGELILRVRERWITGQYPTENVSDTYTLRWSLDEARDGWEVEINDTPELAGALPTSGELRGHVGWAGDVDLLCAPRDAPALRVAVSGVTDVDLVLRSRRRNGDLVARVNELGVGRPEEVTLDPASGVSCVEIKRATGSDGRPGNADDPWVLEVRTVE